MQQSKKMSEDKAKEIYLVGKILIPIGAVLLAVSIIFIMLFLLAYFGIEIDGARIYLLTGVCGPSEIGLVVLITGIIFLLIGKKHLPNKTKESLNEK
ncbi:hypothetical protein FACS1894218_1440 [Bacilli bacterium]|nr:hypothetical protein FACS1894218_1440 [Bacilli bacterium]